jgi:hypothetical protein
MISKYIMSWKNRVDLDWDKNSGAEDSKRRKLNFDTDD